MDHETTTPIMYKYIISLIVWFMLFMHHPAYMFENSHANVNCWFNILYQQIERKL